MVNYSYKSSLLSSSLNTTPDHLINTISSVKENKDTLMLIKALCDPTKLSVFLLLKQSQELTVNTLAEMLDLSQSTISHALSDLKKFGLVDCRTCGQLRCYYVKELSLEKNKALSIFTEIVI